MRERETKTERHSTATLSHRDTWRHNKRAMGIQVDAMTHGQTHWERQAPGNREAEQVSWRHTAQTRKGGLISGNSQALCLPLQLWGFRSLRGVLPRAERRSPVFRTLGKYRQGVTLENWIFSLSRIFPY